MKSEKYIHFLDLIGYIRTQKTRLNHKGTVRLMFDVNFVEIVGAIDL